MDSLDKGADRPAPTDGARQDSGGSKVCPEAQPAGKRDALTVSVRALCAFAARQGDLDFRFTPSPTAQQGRDGHRLVARRRGESYESEIRLSAVCDDLLVSGRADGYDPRHNELEEIKTHRGRIEDIPGNQQALHQAQARLYGWMLCEARGLSTLTVSRVYLELGLEAESRVSETLSAEQLRRFAARLCARYIGWARGEAAHRLRRQRWLSTLEFPLPEFRAGQRALAGAVWKACTRAEILRIEAPTGLGKTLGTVYPALRAMADRPLDRIAVLSARNTTKRVAFEAFEQVRTLWDGPGEHSLCELSLADADENDGRYTPALPVTRALDRAQLVLRNVVPAPFIRSRLERADSIVMFSATMNPFDYDRDLLGLPGGIETLHFDSPFDPSRLQVSVLPVSTRIADRPRTLPRVVSAITRGYDRMPGNYLAFFSSFEYLQRAFERLRTQRPDIPSWMQTRSMNDDDRAGFLARFDPAGCGIGFAVLGGAFGEGVDLPGRRLIGAFIATLGMPQVDRVNQAIAERMQQLFGAGHDYTYLIPGLQKVVQAAGRVIRSPEDQGTLLLIDARYTWPRYRRLLPVAWGLDDGLIDITRRAG